MSVTTDNVRVWYDATGLPNLIGNHSGYPDESGWTLTGLNNFLSFGGASGIPAVPGAWSPNALPGANPTSGNYWLKVNVTTAGWQLLSAPAPAVPGEWANWSVNIGNDPAQRAAGDPPWYFNVSLRAYDADGRDMGAVGTSRTAQGPSSGQVQQFNTSQQALPGQVPSGAATLRLVIVSNGTQGPGQGTLGVFGVARATIRTSPVADFVTPVAFAEPAWQDITRTLTSCRIKRGGELEGVTDAIDTGTATLSFSFTGGSEVDPQTQTRLRRGRALVVTGGPDFYADRLFKGTISTVSADYSGDKTGDPTRVTISANDAVALMRGIPAPIIQRGYTGNTLAYKIGDTLRQAKLANYFLDYPPGGYDVATPVGHVDNWSLWDNLLAIRNSFTAGKVAVDRRGALWYTNAGDAVGANNNQTRLHTFSAAAGAAQSFTEADLEWGVGTLVNSLTVVRHNDSEVDGEKTYGPYTNENSISVWGAVSASVDIVDGTPSTLAGAYLRRFSAGATSPTRLTFPVRTGLEAARLIDVYDRARVQLPARGIDVTWPVIGVEHTITADTWLVSINMRPGDAQAVGTITNPPGGANTGPADYPRPVTAAAVPFASRYATAPVSVPTATWTTLAPGQAVTQDGLTHSAGGQTAPADGRYLVSAGVEFAANATGQRRLRILDTGTAIATVSAAGAAVTNGLTLTKVVRLSAGDVITAQAYQTSGAALNVAGDTARTTFLDVAYLGA